MHSSVSQCVTSTIAPPTSGSANRLSAMLSWAVSWDGAGTGAVRCAARLLHLHLLLGKSRGQRIQDIVVVVVGREPGPRFEIGCCQDSVEEGKDWLHGTGLDACHRRVWDRCAHNVNRDQAG